MHFKKIFLFKALKISKNISSQIWTSFFKEVRCNCLRLIEKISWDKMKSTRVLLLLFSVIPVYIIAHVGLGWFVPLGTSENADRINQVLLNLAYSYVAAMFFAMVWEYIPQLNKEQKAFKMNESNFKKIHTNMQELILSLMMVYDIDKNISSIEIDDLIDCDIYKPSYSKIYYKKCRINAVKEKQILERGVFCFWEDIERFSSKIQKTISIIKGLPTSKNLSLSTLELLSELEECELLDLYKGRKSYPEFYKEEHSISNFPEYIYHFILLYRRMSKLMRTMHVYKMEKLTLQEINELCKERETTINILKQKGIPKSGLIYRNGIRYIINNEDVR